MCACVCVCIHTIFIYDTGLHRFAFIRFRIRRMAFRFYNSFCFSSVAIGQNRYRDSKNDQTKVMIGVIWTIERPNFLKLDNVWVNLKLKHRTLLDPSMTVQNYAYHYERTLGFRRECRHIGTCGVWMYA